MRVAPRASSVRWQATIHQRVVLFRTCRRLREPSRPRPRCVSRSRELHREKPDPHRSSEPTWRCVRIATRQPLPRDRGAVCSMTAGQHAAFVSLPVRRFPSPPRRRNSVGAEAPSCLKCMPARHAQARNIVFRKGAGRRDIFSRKRKESMDKTIEQIAVVAPFDPISVLDPEAALKGIITGQRSLADILKSMLTSLSEGRITDFVAGFRSPFKFTDHALDLQFNEHQRLTEFLEKSRELFPDTVMEAVSVFQSGDAAIAEWKLTATETIAAGSINLRAPILLSGVSIAQFNGGKITRWTDYYDQLTSRRMGLAAFFTEWIEY